MVMLTSALLLTASPALAQETDEEVEDVEEFSEQQPLSIPEYIGTHSRYGWKAVCVSRIETGSWTAFYNPVAWHGEHAQGFFGWLPTTFYSVALPGERIGVLDDEIANFDRMLDRGRAREFYGLGGYRFVDGTGPCYR